MRLNGCPSLTLRESPDPLREDPIAHVDDTCVGCGVCGEVAHAAVLCPSFYEVKVITNPGRWTRSLARVRAGRDRPARRRARERPALLSRAGSRRRRAGGRRALGVDRGRRPASTAIRVHGTSIPGVAQRTGSTTYYVELATERRRRRPSPSRSIPCPARSTCCWRPEFLEVGRMIELGFVSPARTTIIACTHRLYSIHEKIATGRAIYPAEGLRRAAETAARAAGGLRRAGAGARARHRGERGAAGRAGRQPACCRSRTTAFREAIERKGVAVEVQPRGIRARPRARSLGAAPRARTRRRLLRSIQHSLWEPPPAPCPLTSAPPIEQMPERGPRDRRPRRAAARRLSGRGLCAPVSAICWGRSCRRRRPGIGSSWRRWWRGIWRCG